MSEGMPESRPIGWLRPLLIILSLGAFIGFVNFIGCGRVSREVVDQDSKDKTIAPGRDQLVAAVAMIQPDRLGIDAQPQQAAGLLNQWRAAQLEIKEIDRLSEPLSVQTREFLKTHLPGESVSRAQRDDFTIEDVKHVRTARLMKAIADHVAAGVDGELNRAQVVFDYVARNVQLVAEEEAFPLMPYEILVFGQGTAADRAWVFAEILRQLNQDAVIVKPGSTDSKTHWFVAAIDQGKLFLFDSLRATSVPGSADEKDLPATIAELADPAVWLGLTGNDENPFSKESLKNIRLEIIGTSALWSPRHASLENVLTGNDSVVIYQNFGDPKESSSGILNRVSSVETVDGGEIQVGVWAHPEDRLASSQAASGLDESWKPFRCPLQVQVVGENQLVFGNPTNGQLKTRVQQLLGQYKEAIPEYSRLRLLERRLPSEVSLDVRDMYDDAAEDAYFWTGVCQMEQEGYADAAIKFAQYIKDAEQFTQSRHADHARILLARCLAKVGQVADAIAAIEPLKPDSPEFAAAEFLKRQWGSSKSARSPGVEKSQPEKGNPPGIVDPAAAEKPAP